jgi:DNA repair protein RecN (Recombination protein N)
MLSRLIIKNYALIQSLSIAPSPALNIITGETGAGKSIMLGAVGLLLGNRADTKVLLDKNEKCIIEGEFNIGSYQLAPFFLNMDLDYSEETLIRREIAPSGKSRAFVNDTPVTLDTLKALGKNLMDIHSQHETLLLGSKDYQLAVIDAFAQVSDLLVAYHASYKDYSEKAATYESLKREASEIAKEADYNHFLLNELTEANLVEGEQQELENELKILENAEEIKTKLTAALALIDQPEYGTLFSLEQVRENIRQLNSINKEFKALSDRVEELYIELAELNRDISSQDSLVEVNYGRTTEVQERLSLFYSLQQKHQVPDVESLITLRQQLEEKVLEATNMDDLLVQTKLKAEEAEDQALQIGSKLSQARIACLKNFTAELVALLNQLGIPEGKIKIEHEEKPLSQDGTDKITILFSANKGIPVAPLKQVASGGEFTRLMFSIKYLIADKTALPTMVFDEIDSGVSGEIALKMGAMMQQIAENHQVIAISHLPQIAAKGDTHYFVYKQSGDNRSVSKIRELSNSEQVEEIAKMIGGDNPSPSAFASARELMA